MANETLFGLLIKLINSILNDTENSYQQKWINLAVLKCNLRHGLDSFHSDLQSLPFEDRDTVLQEFQKLKDFLWQAVGAVHGNIVSMCMMHEVGFVS